VNHPRIVSWRDSAIWAKPVRHDDFWTAVSFHCFAQKPQCRLAISPLCDACLKHFTFVVNGSPEVLSFAIDPDKSLIQMPPPLQPGPHLCGRKLLQAKIIRVVAQKLVRAR
jgi:hypothetical protein